MIFRIIFLIFCLNLSFQGFSQRNLRDSVIGTPWVAVHYGANGTSGDLADRFGFVNHIGAIAGYKTSKNWFWGMDGNFIFGNKINDPCPPIDSDVCRETCCDDGNATLSPGDNGANDGRPEGKRT